MGARFWASTVSSMVIMLGACSGETTAGWAPPPLAASDLRDEPAPEVRYEDGPVQLRFGVSRVDDGRPGDHECLELTMHGAPWFCMSVERGMGMGTNLAVDGDRVIWRARSYGEVVADDAAELADHRGPDRFVVFSSVSPTGRVIEPIVVEGVISLVWLMEPGEVPWGYQEVDAVGRLIQAHSLLGLPAE